MKRKVNRVGQNTLTVSLPLAWARKHKITYGDELEVLEDPNGLFVSTGKTNGRKLTRVSLDLDSFNKMMLNRYLHEFYRQGVEEIELKFTNSTIPDYKTGKPVSIDKNIKKVIQRFIGMEIVSQTPNKIVLQSLIKQEEQSNMDVIQRRSYFLIKEFLDEFVKAMDGDFKTFHDVSYDYHDNITRFMLYYLRLLHFSDMDAEKKNRLFGLFSVIDTIIDKVRHMSERVNEMKTITPKIKKYVKHIFELFLAQFDFILKKNIPLSEQESLIKERYGLVKNVESEKFSYEELLVIAEAKILLDTMIHFCETYVALNIDEYKQIN